MPKIPPPVETAADALAPYFDAVQALEVAEVVVQAIRDAGYMLVGQGQTVFMTHGNLPPYEGDE